MLPLRSLSRLARTTTRRAFSTTLLAAAQQQHGVSRLAVVGAGQMGLGIALVAARTAEVPVTLIDTSTSSLEKALTFAQRLIEKDVSKSRITTADASSILARLETATDLAAVSGADFIIEAVPEIPSLKKDIFGRLAELSGGDAVLATNTSSISITAIAAAAHGASDRVVATHFMNPVPVQRGVELISGLQTSERTLQRAVEFVTAMGRIPSVSKDAPGFLANRILMPYINEAVVCLETGVGGRDDIDSIMKNGTNVPMGPLQLADFIGLDTCLAIMKVLYEDTGDSKYRPAVLLKKYVDAGWLGKKSGRGFYEYEN